MIGAPRCSTFLTTLLTAITYSNYKGKIRLFAEVCIDEEGISPLDRSEVTCVRYLALIAERGTIGAVSLQPYLFAIKTSMRYIGRDYAPATGPTIIDTKRGRLRDVITVADRNISLFVNIEKAGHRKRRDGFKPQLQMPAIAVPTWTDLLRRFVVYQRRGVPGAPRRQATQ
eukprot:jgi/Tetstr1/432140/TSEL_021597.t1